MPDVFKALAAGSRRQILDALFATDGQTLAELCRDVAMSRQGVSKHLNVLEAAGLIVTEFRGRRKLHYLNPVPIRDLCDRWLAKYAKEQLDAVIGMKQALEDTVMTAKKSFAYQNFIRARQEKVWEALTSTAFTARYFYGTKVESTWQPGAPVTYRYAANNEVAVVGEVNEVEPPHKLVISWHVQYDAQAMQESPSKVTFLLDEDNNQTRLRILHDEFPEHSVVFDEIVDGWPWILSGLKSLLETGEARPASAA